MVSKPRHIRTEKGNLLLQPALKLQQLSSTSHPEPFQHLQLSQSYTELKGDGLFSKCILDYN